MLEGRDAAILALVLAIFVVVSMIWSPPPIEKPGMTVTPAASIIGPATPRVPRQEGSITTSAGTLTEEGNVSIPWVLRVKLPKVRPKVGFLQALIARIKEFFAWLSSLFTLPPEQPRNITALNRGKGAFPLPAAVIASATLAILGAYVMVIRRRAMKGRDAVVTGRRVRRGGPAEEVKGLKELGVTPPENELVEAIKALAARLGRVAGRKPDVITHREVLQLIKRHWDELGEDLRASAVNAVHYYELWRFAGKELRGEWLEEARRVVRGAGGDERTA